MDASPAPPGASASVTVYRQPGARSVAVYSFYLLLVGLLLFAAYRGVDNPFSTVVVPLLILVLLVYLARYGSTRYRIDDRSLWALRLFGSRRIKLSSIRKIQRANLRNLGAVGFLGTWGWRGRVWSPLVGNYDTVHTSSDGLLVSGSGVPLFISPADPEEFQRELSRRVRSIRREPYLDESPAAASRRVAPQ